ncbi:MAG: hypothetical protein ACFFFG_08315 [Candidatus Thorarchaeota archaeon]
MTSYKEFRAFKYPFKSSQQTQTGKRKAALIGHRENGSMNRYPKLLNRSS